MKLSDHQSRAVDSAPAPEPITSKKAAKAKKVAAVERSETIRKAPAAPAGAVTSVAVDMWEPQLRDRAQAVLNRGARLDVAAADFATAEEFLTVAHAARNTDVPFMVLKHRVLNEGRTLTDAIREYNPAVDAKSETARARTEARSDLADVS
ncbi:MAG TPA: hypothetical protein VFJ02_10160 [Vicinamibacterales bacterium]|nr:hypothetical protein [Vicinamibacterales bacterium]